MVRVDAIETPDNEICYGESATGSDLNVDTTGEWKSCYCCLAAVTSGADFRRGETRVVKETVLRPQRSLLKRESACVSDLPPRENNQLGVVINSDLTCWRIKHTCAAPECAGIRIGLYPCRDAW